MFKKNFIRVFSIAFLIYPISFLNQLAISYFFGTTEILDLYWLSMSTAIFLTIHISPIKEVITKEYFELRKKDLKNANSVLSQNLNLSILISLFIGIILWFFPIKILTYISGNTIVYPAKAILMLRLLIIYMVLQSFSEIMGSILVSLGKVIHQNIGKLFTVLFTLIIMLSLTSILHELVLVIGLLTGMVIYLIIQLIELKKFNINLIFTLIPKFHKNVISKFGILFFATIAGYALNLFERNVFSNISTGMISSYQYGRSLNDIAQNLFVLALATSLWPNYLKSIYERDIENVYEITRKKIFFITILFTLFTILFYVFAPHIVYLIYFRGSFGEESLHMTVLCFRAIVLSMVPIALNTIFTRALFSFNAVYLVSLSLFAGTSIGFLFLYFGKELQQINLAVHNLVAFNVFSLIVLSLSFLKYIKKISLHLFTYVFIWIVKIIFSSFLIIKFYPFPVFEVKSKYDITIELLIHGTFASILLMMLWFAIGIIKIKHFQRLYREFTILKSKLIDQ